MIIYYNPTLIKWGFNNLNTEVRKLDFILVKQREMENLRTNTEL